MAAESNPLDFTKPSSESFPPGFLSPLRVAKGKKISAKLRFQFNELDGYSSKRLHRQGLAKLYLTASLLPGSLPHSLPQFLSESSPVAQGVMDYYKHCSVLFDLLYKTKFHHLNNYGS